MRCRYCKEKLNIFKSLAGSSFCSPEHRKLYEEAEANKGFERLLQFVEKDGKGSAGPAKAPVKPLAQPDTPPVVPEPVAAPEPVVSAHVERAPDAAAEPPVAEFFREKIAPVAVSAPSRLEPNFEALEPDFPGESPALPSFKFEIAAAVPEASVPEKSSGEWPPQLASWSHTARTAVDTTQPPTAIPSVGSVRPRTIALSVPSPVTRSSAAAVPPLLCGSQSAGLEVRVQALIDTRDIANLALLNALPRQARTVTENSTQGPADPGLAALPQAGALQTLLPSAQKGRETTLGMSGAMARAGIGRSVSPPVPRWPATRLALSQLTRPGFLKVDRGDGFSAVAMNGVMTRSGVARALRQPRASAKMVTGTLGSNQVLNQVVPEIQNAPGMQQCRITPARPAQRECIVPASNASAPGVISGLAPAGDRRKVTIQECDTPAGGIRDVITPAVVSSPLFIPDIPAFRPFTGIALNRAIRRVTAQAQTNDRAQHCQGSPARSKQRDCLFPAILWTSKTWLPSAIASVTWFHESDCISPAFPSAAAATSRRPLRFAPEPHRIQAPQMACDRRSRHFTLSACEWKLEVQGLARSRFLAPSPLSLVTRPRPCITLLAARSIATLTRFSSIANAAQRGPAASPATSALTAEHMQMAALPGLPRSLGAGVRSPVYAAVKWIPIGPAGPQGTGVADRPQPSPLRVQPASMLVMPRLSITVRRTRWAAKARWATVASPRQSRHDAIQLLSSEETSLPALRSLADALTLDGTAVRDSAALRLHPGRPAISMELGAQTPAPGVLAANALPRRRGPTLPLAAPRLNESIVPIR